MKDSLRGEKVQVRQIISESHGHLPLIGRGSANVSTRQIGGGFEDLAVGTFVRSPDDLDPCCIEKNAVNRKRT